MSGPSPAARRRQQQVARLLRRSPRLRRVSGEVVRRVRRNDTVTDLVWRVLAPEDLLGARPVPLHPGRHLTGRDVVFLPVVGILATGLTDAQAEALVEEVAALQRAERSFRPLLVLDRPVLAAARRHGFVVELVTPAERWADLPGGSADRQHWLDHLGRRLASITQHYQLFHLARVDAAGRLDPTDVALVRQLRGRLRPDLDVRAADG